MQVLSLHSSRYHLVVHIVQAQGAPLSKLHPQKVDASTKLIFATGLQILLAASLANTTL
jgi:hypothetical protein